MADHTSSRHRSLLDAVAEDAERLQAAIRTHTTTATSADGRITVAVSADGGIREWHVAGIDTHTHRLMADLVELIEQAHASAQEDIRAELDAIADRDEVRTARDTVHDALARTLDAPSSTAHGEAWDEEYYDNQLRGKSRIAAD
ncbi:hypothetical protein [Nocardia sp. NPDC004722]